MYIHVPGALAWVSVHVLFCPTHSESWISCEPKSIGAHPLMVLLHLQSLRVVRSGGDTGRMWGERGSVVVTWWGWDRRWGILWWMTIIMSKRGMMSGVEYRVRRCRCSQHYLVRCGVLGAHKLLQLLRVQFLRISYTKYIHTYWLYVDVYTHTMYIHQGFNAGNHVHSVACYTVRKCGNVCKLYSSKTLHTVVLVKANFTCVHVCLTKSHRPFPFTHF